MPTPESHLYFKRHAAELAGHLRVRDGVGFDAGKWVRFAVNFIPGMRVSNILPDNSKTGKGRRGRITKHVLDVSTLKPNCHTVS